MVRKIIVVGGGSAGFLAALALKVKMPDLRVVVIRSKDIGIIGVGEGSTVPLTTFLHGFLKADFRKLLRMAEPTWKMGLKFKWGPRPYFYYPFGPDLDFTPHALSRNIAFYCDDDLEDSTLEMAMIHRDRIFFAGPDGQPRLHNKLAYHIENEKFVAYLEAFARHSGVEIVEDTIRNVRQDGAGISGLDLASGQSESADLYVDCSGFSSLLLGKTLGEPFVSYRSSLACDRAVVGGWDRGPGEPIHPYTTSESMSAGWCWQIEHVRRINRGYVYSSAFISDSDAEQEFRAKNRGITSTRVVKFVSGRYERGWVKNVVAIGNSSGFVEPLEATALGVIAARSQVLAQILIESDRRIDPFQVGLYNRHHARLWDAIRDFLACHYKFNEQQGTPFWRHCAHETDLAGARPMVEYYEKFGPAGTWGPVLIDSLCPFGTKGYLMILVGQKAPHKRPYTPDPKEREAWDNLRRRNVEEARSAMTVAQSLRALGVPDVPAGPPETVAPKPTTMPSGRPVWQEIGDGPRPA